jgi:hypothetical protein
MLSRPGRNLGLGRLFLRPPGPISAQQRPVNLIHPFASDGHE